jgi:uncharacterized membrane protein YhaH (DUF805 family)
MGFAEAVQKGIANIGNFEGRAGRSEFWWLALAVWAAEFVLWLLISAIFRGGFGSLLLFVVWIVAFLAIVSVGVRRLHDVGQTGWLLLLWLIPCIGLVLIYFFVQPTGTTDNQYGPAPAA